MFAFFNTIMGTSEVPPPNHFLCPITGLIMEFPYTTAAGHTYEYYAIRDWLAQGKRTDPMTGLPLDTAQLFPNHTLRSQIREWIDSNKDTEQFRNPEALEDYNDPNKAVKENEGTSTLSDILSYDGKDSEEKASGSFPNAFKFGKRVYQISEGKNKSSKERYVVSCDEPGMVSAEVPEKAMFATSEGICFYNPEDIYDTKVGPSGKDACRFKQSCTKDKCSYGHDFACKEGVKCSNKSCKYLHPQPESVIPLQAGSKLAKACKYGTGCSNKKCDYAHPLGKLRATLKNRKFFYTHSMDLHRLQQSAEVEMDDFPKNATKCQFQGAFAFFFSPYKGAWAKDFFQKVDVFMYDEGKRRHIHVGEWTLENHFVRSVCASGKFLVISFWPYDEEAARALFESGYTERQLIRLLKGQIEKNSALHNDLQSKEAAISRKERIIKKEKKALQRSRKENASLKKSIAEKTEAIESKEETIRQQKRQLKKKDSENQHLKGQAKHKDEKILQQHKAMKDQEKELLRKDGEISNHKETLQNVTREKGNLSSTVQSLQSTMNAQLEQVRQLTRQLEAERNERLRNRDPIHIYVMETSGTTKEDWTLVLDYHKGAHSLKLGDVDSDGSRKLFVTVNDDCFKFRLKPPEQILQEQNLPVVPDKLCDEF